MIHPFFATAGNPGASLGVPEKLARLEALASHCDVHDLDAVAWVQEGPGLLLALIDDVKGLSQMMDLAISLSAALDDLREKLDEISLQALEHANTCAATVCAAELNSQAEAFGVLASEAKQIADRAREPAKAIDELATQWEKR